VTGTRGAEMASRQASISPCLAMKKSFAEQLRRVILDCGETRYSLAQRMGIAESTLSRFMNGSRGLSMEVLDRLFDALNLEITPASSPTRLVDPAQKNTVQIVWKIYKARR
jgi:transcriptional regulator with XRE-family HTH domain